MKNGWLLLVFFAHMAFAQNNLPDSMELRFSATKTDENRLAILTEMVNIAFGKDLTKALQYANRGVQLAEKTGDKKGTADVFN